MSVITKRLSRRVFLGGAGAAIGLPLLRSIVPARAAADTVACAPPKRFLAMFVPNGIVMRSWTPAATGREWALTPTLAPLAPVKDDLIVVSGLTHPGYRTQDIGHPAGVGSFLSCKVIREGETLANGISMDQVAAEQIGACTRIPSMQLGLNSGGSRTGTCAGDYACAYELNISWANASTPLGPLNNPSIVFDQLFAGFDPTATDAEQLRRRVLRKSVLDYALDDATSLSARLATSDRLKLDQYLTAVRDLELRIERSSSGPSCAIPERPGEPIDVPDHIDIFNELMVLAFQCDITRVITFMFDRALSGRAFPWLGIPDDGAHHRVSHHENIEANLVTLERIDNWYVSQLANLLVRLKETEDVDGSSLLHNTCVYYASDIEDGQSHLRHNMPVLLAGQLGGAFDTGRHIRYAPMTPKGNLFVSILNALGVGVTSFGDDGREPLGELG